MVPVRAPHAVTGLFHITRADAGALIQTGVIHRALV